MGLKRIFLSAVFAACFFSIFYVFNFKRRILPVRVKENLVEIVEDIREIRLQERFLQPFNPTVIPVDDGYLMIFRSTTDSFWGFVKRYIFKVHNEKNFWVLWDANFKQVGGVQELLIPSDKGEKWHPEDFRLVCIGGEIYGVFNDQLGSMGSKSPGRRSMYLARFAFTNNQLEMKHRIPLHFPGAVEFYNGPNIESFVEKNWTPFVFENELYLLYTIDPFLVLKPNLETGECVELSRKNFDVACFAFPRGGTPGIVVDDCFVSFYHAFYKEKETRWGLKQQCYYMGAFAFSKEVPFDVIGKIDAPIGNPDMYFKRKIVFPSSLIYRDGKLRLFWGADDKKMFMGTVRCDAMMGMFKKRAD